jgi:hypothetical protein
MSARWAVQSWPVGGTLAPGRGAAGGYEVVALEGGADSETVGAEVRPLDCGSTGSVVSVGGVGSLASDGGVEVLGAGSVDGGDDGGSVVGSAEVLPLGSGTVTGGGGAVVSLVGGGLLDGAPDPAGGTTTLGGSDDCTAAVGSAETDASVDEDEAAGALVGVTGDVVPGSTVPPAELGTIAANAVGSTSAGCEVQPEQTWTATASSACIWYAAVPTESRTADGTWVCSLVSVSTERPVNSRRSTIACSAPSSL